MIAHIRDASQTLTRWDGNGNETPEYYDHAIVVDNVVTGPDRTYVHIRDPNGASYYSPIEALAQ